MYTPTISLVVITRNEGAELQATVTNLFETTPPDRRELIVVDDGSTDGSTQFLADLPEARLLRSSGLGVAKARNFGASHARGDAIVFCDAHIRAPHGWHEALLEPLQDPRVGATAPGIYSLTEPRRRGFGLNFVGPELHARWKFKPGKTPIPVPILPGAFLAMRREVFAATGGFDNGMRQLGGNDNELSLRLWLLGYELLIVPTVEVGHLFRTSVPFEATWTSVVHNRLRLAFVHFQHSRIERVIDALRAYQAFPAGLALTLDQDVAARRQALQAARRYSDDWFFEKFDLEC